MKSILIINPPLGHLKLIGVWHKGETPAQNELIHAGEKIIDHLLSHP
ncbi:MAG: hypothetical protein KIT27_10080 [Legionellales bacterium]|nr:hypothetical protein [Legionellales bacterium]